MNPTSNVERENAYLRQRNAQLQDDITALSAEVTRQRQLLERMHARGAPTPSGPAGG